MSLTVSQSFQESPDNCYQKVIDLLPRLGFEIVRRREIAWLLQARKNVNGRWLNLNIQCRLGAQTQIIVSCQNCGDEKLEKSAVDGLFEAMRGISP